MSSGIAPPCGSYCLGPVHVHPQTTLSQDLLMVGHSLAGLPGLLGEASSHQEPQTPAQPLTEKIVDNIYFGVMSVLAVGSAPVLVVSAGVAYVGEKVLETIDILHGMGKKVEEFGRGLSEQEKIIEQLFGPLLALTEKVADLSRKTVERTQEVKNNTSELTQLAASYPVQGPLLERVSALLIHLESDLPPQISHEKISGMKEQALISRITILKQIADEERILKELAARLNGIMVRVGQKAEILHQLGVEVTQTTQTKDIHLIDLQREAELIAALPTQKETYVAIASPVVF
jgi:hypothetical protein